MYQRDAMNLYQQFLARDIQELSKDILEHTPKSFKKYMQQVLKRIKQDPDAVRRLYLMRNLRLDIGISTYSVLGQEAISIAKRYVPEKFLDLESLEELLHMPDLDVKFLTLLDTTENITTSNIVRFLLKHTDDFRYLFVFLVDRFVKILHFYVERVGQEHERYAAAHRSRTVYAPLSEFLNLPFMFKALFEDYAFSVLNPKMYEYILEFYRKHNVGDETKTQIQDLLQDALHEYEPNIAKIYGRVKSLYSTYNKLFKYEKEGKKPSLDQLHDLIAFRVITKDIDTVYDVLFKLTQIGRPLYELCDDYISHPKPNGYQAYHLVIYFDDQDFYKLPVEVQILTEHMDYVNTYGSASHIVYKAKKQRYAPAASGYEWVFDIHSKILEYQSATDRVFTMPLKIEGLFEDLVFVFTPRGKIITLPKGATALDFAYRIHTQVGMLAQWAQVDGKNQKLDYVLQGGETVKIVTLKPGARSAPPARFLEIAKTEYARDKIRRQLRQATRQKLL